MPSHLCILKRIRNEANPKKNSIYLKQRHLGILGLVLDDVEVSVADEAGDDVGQRQLVPGVHQKPEEAFNQLKTERV